VDLNELGRITRKSLSRGKEFDINPTDLLAHLEIVRKRLK